MKDQAWLASGAADGLDAAALFQMTAKSTVAGHALFRDEITCRWQEAFARGQIIMLVRRADEFEAVSPRIWTADPPLPIDGGCASTRWIAANARIATEISDYARKRMFGDASGSLEGGLTDDLAEYITSLRSQYGSVLPPDHLWPIDDQLAHPITAKKRDFEDEYLNNREALRDFIRLHFHAYDGRVRALVLADLPPELEAAEASKTRLGPKTGEENAREKSMVRWLENAAGCGRWSRGGKKIALPAIREEHRNRYGVDCSNAAAERIWKEAEIPELKQSGRPPKGSSKN